MSYTNITERAPNQLLTTFGLQIHILAAGYGYDMDERTLILPKSVTQQRPRKK